MVSDHHLKKGFQLISIDCSIDFPFKTLRNQLKRQDFNWFLNWFSFLKLQEINWKNRISIDFSIDCPFQNFKKSIEKTGFQLIFQLIFLSKPSRNQLKRKDFNWLFNWFSFLNLQEINWKERISIDCSIDFPF